MEFNVPGSLVLSAVVFTATSLAVLAYQVRELRKIVCNGISEDIKNIKRNCIRYHADSFPNG